MDGNTADPKEIAADTPQKADTPQIGTPQIGTPQTGGKRLAAKILCAIPPAAAFTCGASMLVAFATERAPGLSALYGFAAMFAPTGALAAPLLCVPVSPAGTVVAIAARSARLAVLAGAEAAFGILWLAFLESLMEAV